MIRRSNMKEALLSIAAAFVLAATAPVFATDDSSEATSNVAQSVESEVKAETEDQTVKRREKIIEEAVDALSATKAALKALDEGRTDDAIDSLALATGKLELIVSRAPDLALAPTDVVVTTHDLYGTPEAISTAIERAEEALEDGKIQTARDILDALGSEIIISVTNLPLATYPDAIKAITPLLDDGKIEEAKRALQAALNTQVVTEHVIPLPVVRAEAFLTRAETLAGKEDRTEEESESLGAMLADARAQLEMAELLGYGDEDNYEEMYAHLDELEERIAEGSSGKTLFGKIRNSLSELWRSVVT